MEYLRNALEQRGILGDAILDALDLVEDIVNVGGMIDENGNAILYHAPSLDNAIKIVEEQAMFGKEDGIYFSTKPDGEIVGYGNVIIRTTIPLEKLVLDDSFQEELHLRHIVKPKQKVNVIAELYSEI